METVLQALGAMLAAAGLLALAWFCFGKLLLPVSGEGGGPVYAVLPAAGEGETLEHDVRALCWLRGSEAARFPSSSPTGDSANRAERPPWP